MRASDNVFGVQESERIGIRLRHEADFGQSRLLNAGAITGFYAEPPNPEEFHDGRRCPFTRSNAKHRGVEDTEDLRIPIRVSTRFGLR